MECDNCKIEMIERANHWYCESCTGVIIKTYSFFWKDKGANQ